MGFTAAVIGGGPGGIAASLNLRRAGAMVTCFELNSTVGGLWATAHGPTAGTSGGTLPGSGYSAFGARGLLSPIYPAMRCILPKDAMAFSDHRFSFLVAQFPHYAAVHEYLQDYAVRKGVAALTRFNTYVESVEWLGDRKEDGTPVDGAESGAPTPTMRDTTSLKGGNRNNVWRVRTVNVANGDVAEWKFDCVVVAAGRHHRPRMPDPNHEATIDATARKHEWRTLPPIPHQMRYLQAGGKVLHSSETKRFRDFAGKTVVVYGNGVSAYDYVRELNAVGALVVHATEPELACDDGGGGDGTGAAAPHTTLTDRLNLTTRSAFRRWATRYDPLQNPRFVPLLLGRRNMRLRQSLLRVLHDSAAGGEYNKELKHWQRGADMRRAERLTMSDATREELGAAADVDIQEALRGVYANVPTLGRIVRFGKRAADYGAGMPGMVDPEKTPEYDERYMDSDVVIALSNPAPDGATKPATAKARSMTDTVAEAAADAVADASVSKRTSGQLGQSKSPTQLLHLLRKAEFSPYEPKSVALLSKFSLVRDPAVASGDDAAPPASDDAKPEDAEHAASDGAEHRVTALRVKNVDAVICCTGFYQTFPFIKDDAIRRCVEYGSRMPIVELPSGRTDQADVDDAAAKERLAADKAQRTTLYQHLYMGTILRQNPTMAFLGLQSEIVPPFLLLEAQSAYAGAVFSQRVPLPDTDEAMTRREMELSVPNSRLASVRGLGVAGSAAYYDALLLEANLARTHYGYYETMYSGRRNWFLGTSIVSAAHMFRGMAPQRREKQHTIISNEV